jgi:hypothetical protein
MDAPKRGVIGDRKEDGKHVILMRLRMLQGRDRTVQLHQHFCQKNHRLDYNKNVCSSSRNSTASNKFPGTTKGDATTVVKVGDEEKPQSRARKSQNMRSRNNEAKAKIARKDAQYIRRYQEHTVVRLFSPQIN